MSTQYLDKTGLTTLVGQIKAADTATLNAAKAYVGTIPSTSTKTNAIEYLLDEISASEFSGNAVDVAITDAGNHFTATEVESALAELAVLIETLNGEKTVTGSVAKSIADAIGELKIGSTTYTTVVSYVDAKDAAIVRLIDATNGDLSSLKTTAKTDLVSAINELVDDIDDIDFSGKADKVASATAGNFAGLDADGNLTDSGKKASDFVAARTFGTAADADVATVAIEGEGEVTTALPTVGQVETYVTSKVAGLTSAMHFRGIVAKLDDVTDPKSGDIAIVGVKEYVYNGTDWQELGDEGAYVVKEDGKSLVSDTEITKLAGVSTGANKVEASTTNGNIKIDGTETTVYTPDANTVIDANYAHITVTENSVSDGTTTFSVSSITDTEITDLFK